MGGRDDCFLAGISFTQIPEMSLSYADVTEKMEQLKAARAKRGRIYNSVEEFMTERAMIINLVMARGEDIKVTAFTFVICTSSASCSDRYNETTKPC